MKKYILAIASIGLLAACNNSGSSNTSNDSTSVTNRSMEDTVGHMADSATSATSTVNASPMNDVDREFAMKAGMGNTAEIEAGNLANSKGNIADVKDFGAMMVKDHGDAQAKLKTIGQSLALNVPDSVDGEHKAMKAKLSGMAGKAFDQAYIGAQVKDHTATVALFEKEINNGSNAQLKDFANATLPHIKMHLQKATELQAARH